MSIAVPVPRTWSPFDFVTAAELNTEIHDAVTFLSAPPLFVAAQSATQSIATGTVVPINFDTETVDSYNGHSNTSNNSRYTAQVAGWYLVCGQVAWAGSSAGYRTSLLTVNGGSFQNTEMPASASTVFMVPAVARSLFLNVGDYVELNGYQTSGAALSTYSSGAYQSTFNVLWCHS